MFNKRAHLLLVFTATPTSRMPNYSPQSGRHRAGTSLGRMWSPGAMATRRRRLSREATSCPLSFCLFGSLALFAASRPFSSAPASFSASASPLHLAFSSLCLFVSFWQCCRRWSQLMLAQVGPAHLPSQHSGSHSRSFKSAAGGISTPRTSASGANQDFLI